MIVTGRKFRYLLISMLQTIRAARAIVWSFREGNFQDMIPMVCGDYVGSIHTFFDLVQGYCGDGDASLGDRKRRPKTQLWPKPTASPTETLRDMRLIAEGAHEAEEDMNQIIPEGEIIGLDAARMRARHTTARQIILGKFDILTKDPAFWTEALEMEFKPFLEYFPKAE